VPPHGGERRQRLHPLSPALHGAKSLVVVIAGLSWSPLSRVGFGWFAVLAVVLFLYLISGLLGRLLGKTGLNVVTRLLGMLLAALAVQFILDGLRAFGFAS